MQFNAYTIALYISAVVSAALAVYAYRHRSVPAGTEMTLLLAAISFWSLMSALEGYSTGQAAKTVFSVMSYVGSQSTPVLFFLFALRYTQQDRWLTRRHTAYLLAVPFISVIMAATNGWHHLVWPTIDMMDGWAGVTAVYAHGPWFWFMIVYDYFLLLLGMIALARVAFGRNRLYSLQSRIILVAVLIPWVGNIIYSFLPSSVAGLEFTPVTFTLTGALVAAAVFRYRLLDLGPIARNVLFEGIRDVMLALDRGNRVVDVNPVARELIGLPEPSIIGRPAEEIFSDWPELLERLGPDPAPVQGEVEITLDGIRRFYDLRVWPLLGRSGRMLGRLVNMHDMTALRLAQEELRRINEALDGYAHTVSHDLKGPLTAISLANETLEKLLGMPEARDRNENISRMSDIMSTNMQKAISLIDGLLLLAEAGQKPSNVRKVDIAEVVGRVLEEREQDMSRRGTRAEACGLDTVRADPTHMYQLFSNLIGNAIKHNDSPEPLVRISMLEAEGDLHRYLVRDNGSGIPADNIARIFTPFFKSGRSGDTGLGLATAQRIAEVYGGGIRAFNDDGACFEVTIRDYGSGAGRSAV